MQDNFTFSAMLNIIVFNVNDEGVEIKSFNRPTLH